MKSIILTIAAALAVIGAARADLAFSVFDNGLTDIKSVEEQAGVLEELGYDGICTRPAHASDELIAAMDRHGREISASYVVLPAQADGEDIPPDVVEHVRKLKGRGTIVWLSLINPKAKDEVAVSLIRKVCDLAAGNGLEVALYPHVGFRTNTVAECERLRKLAERPKLGVSFNLCHFLCQNDSADLETTIRSVAPHLKLVQISGGDALPPGKSRLAALDQAAGRRDLRHRQGVSRSG